MNNKTEAQQQEPVAYSYTSRITGAQGFSHHPMPRFMDSDSWDIKPLYTTPPQRKPLTNEEIIEWVESGEYNVTTNDWASHIAFARAIEAKLREKNQ